MFARLLILTLLIGAAAQGTGSTLVAQSVPFSCADTVQRTLGMFRGAWQVQAIFRNGETGWDTTKAMSTFTPDLHACVLREDYKGTRYGEPYDFLALWGANGQPENRIQRFFSHSLHGIFGLASGGFQGDTLVLNENITVNNQPLLLQYRFTRPSPAPSPSSIAAPPTAEPTGS